jgi:hypothetical protein
LDLSFVCKNAIPCGYDLALAHTLYCKRFVRLRVLKFAHHQPFGQRVIPSGHSAIHCIRRLDDMSNCLNAHQTKASSVPTTWIPVRTFLYVKKLRTAPACIRPDDLVARPDDPQCSIKLQDFLPNTDMGRLLQPDDVDSRPDTLIHKASIAIQIQTSGSQSGWSGRACIRYGNCVHQINRPDDHSPSPDARNPYMEITCIERVIVWTIGHHRPNAALKYEGSLAKFSEFRSHSCPSGQPMTTVWTAPSFIKPDAHLNC